MNMFEKLLSKGKNHPVSPDTPRRDVSPHLNKVAYAALASTLLFLSSCEGSHERASAQDIKNHIENPNFEKIDQNYLSSIKDTLAKNPEHIISGSAKAEGGSWTRDWRFSETDSTLVLDAVNYHSDMDLRDKDHIEVDKETGVVSLSFNTYPAADNDTMALMVINKDGKVLSKGGYIKGDGKTAFQADVSVGTASVSHKK